MTRWFRFYDDAMHDPKLLRLSDSTYRAWTILLCVASKHNGVLPPAEEIAVTLRCKPALVAGWIAELVSVVLLDKTESGYIPHNWEGRQYKSDSSAERVKRHRDKARNATCNVTPPVTGNVTVTVQNRTEADTETEQKETRVTALDDGWPSDFREQFWNLYPHKIGKADAIAKLERVRRRCVSWVALMDGLRRYIASKPVDRPWCNPATWLNQARWEDQPAGSVAVQASPAEEGDAFWDDVLTSFKRFGTWSRDAGPNLDSPACRAPAAMLAKHGLLRTQTIPVEAPRLKAMGDLH